MDWNMNENILAFFSVPQISLTHGFVWNSRVFPYSDIFLCKLTSCFKILKILVNALLPIRTSYAVGPRILKQSLYFCQRFSNCNLCVYLRTKFYTDTKKLNMYHNKFFWWIWDFIFLANKISLDSPQHPKSLWFEQVTSKLISESR